MSADCAPEGARKVGRKYSGRERSLVARPLFHLIRGDLTPHVFVLRDICRSESRTRRGDFPNQSFDFLGFTFRARKTVWQGHIHAHGFMPAASPAALKFMSRTIRRWALHHRSDKSLQELAAMYNPCIRGWINYYGNFYRTKLRPTLKRIDLYVIRWARRKFKRLRRKTKGARNWFDRLRRANPTLFAHWQLCHGNGRTSGAV